MLQNEIRQKLAIFDFITRPAREVLERDCGFRAEYHGEDVR